VVDVNVNEPRLEPDAVITLGEWDVRETGERVELACVVLRPAGQRVPGVVEPLDIVRPEPPLEVRELALFVLEAWREARGLGS
jgi:hypothetical protein